jgi:hypothetical protein
VPGAPRSLVFQPLAQALTATSGATLPSARGSLVTAAGVAVPGNLPQLAAAGAAQEREGRAATQVAQPLVLAASLLAAMQSRVRRALPRLSISAALVGAVVRTDLSALAERLPPMAAAGGGSGGGITTGNAGAVGGTGGAVGGNAVAGAAGGAGGNPSTAGASGGASVSHRAGFGGGGGGGGGSLSTPANGSAGGAGQAPGGGGGGGGACVAGMTSGAGGAGGAGLVVVEEFF